MLSAALRKRHFVLAAALAGAAVSLAQGPDVYYEGDGPIILERPRPQEQGLRFNPFALSLQLEASFQNSEFRTGGNTFRSQSWLFTQLVTASTTGYYKHPNYLELNLSLTGGLNEEFSNDNFGSDQNVGALYYWNTSATLLRNGDWPLTVYSRRQDNWLFRDFGGAVRSTSTVTGASVEHHTGSTDHMLNISRTHVEQSGDGPFDDSEYVQDRFSWISFARLSQRQTLRWEYEYTRSDESGFVDYDSQTHDATLTHELTLGNNNYDNLTSSLHFTRHEASRTTDRLRWTERLRLRHSPDLRTRYNYSFDYYDLRGGSARTLHRADAGFTHTLYRSLTTDGRVGGSRGDSSEGGSNTGVFANISTTYRKNMIDGAFTGNVGVGWARDESEGGGAVQVFNQGEVFNDPLPIILVGPSIDPRTIVITDPSGLLLIPGADYNLTDFGDRIEVTRVVGGRIGPGDAVLIDYVQGALPPSITETRTFNAGARYDFNDGLFSGLSLYTRYATLEQNLDTPFPAAFAPNEYTDRIYGAEYRIREFTFGAEHQDHDSVIFPYNADRYFARYVKRTETTTSSLNAAFTNVEYETDGNEIDLFTLSANVSHRFSMRVYGELTLLWRDETNRFFGDTQGFEEQLTLRWQHRQLEAYMRLRASQLNSEDSRSRFEFIQVGVIRQF